MASQSNLSNNPSDPSVDSVSADYVRPPGDTAFFGHPSGLLTLFFAEMWERFSYYGMRAILGLFMVLAVEKGGLGFSKGTGGVVLALYTSMVYLAGVAGGWLADNILGQRRATFWGGVTIMIGHICLAFHGLPLFFGGLALIIAGTGLLKPNITTMVGLLYDPKDTRRDSGFALYYMGVNIGSFVGQTVCGFLAQHAWFRDRLQSVGIDPRSSWHFGFAAAAVGMFAGLIVFVLRGGLLGEAGKHPTPVVDEADAKFRRKVVIGGIIGLLAVVGGGYLAYASGNLPDAQTINLIFGSLLLFMTIAAFSKIFFFTGLDANERTRMMVVFILFFASVLFWGAFEQAAGSLNIFADEKSQVTLFGTSFPSSWYQNINPFGIMVLSPFFAWLWMAWGTRAPSSPAKFSIGLVMVGLGFAVASWGSSVFDHTHTRLSPLWLASVYVLHTIGELFLSPIGLSMVSKLSPKRVVSQVMSVWFLSNANANFLAHQTLVLQEKYKLTDTNIFLTVALVTIGAGILLACFVKPIRKMMGGVH